MSLDRQRVLVYGDVNLSVHILASDSDCAVETVSADAALWPLPQADWLLAKLQSAADEATTDDLPGGGHLNGDLQLALSGLLDSAPDGIAVLGNDGTVLWHNAVFLRILNLPDSLCGRQLDGAVELAGSDDGTFLNLPVPESPEEQTRLIIRLSNRTDVGMRIRRLPRVGRK
ncbi:MAG: PAS domain-containing protein, partial [Planctomycetaceae bacterium]|nr:PAS domain-containing protein [Planctomycetaceae bacterium]